MTMQARTRQPGIPARCTSRSSGERLLIGLEFFIGATAVMGGLALFARPDGSLLQANLSALSGTPFSDWRVPGLLLLMFMGGGSLLTAFRVWRHLGNARALAVFSGFGVLAFELTERATIGFQPLEAVVGVLALLEVLLAWRLPGIGQHIDSAHQEQGHA